MNLIIWDLAILAFLWVDYLLYAKTVRKYGAQYNLWPGSGFYVAFKHRKGGGM